MSNTSEKRKNIINEFLKIGYSLLEENVDLGTGSIDFIFQKNETNFNNAIHRLEIEDHTWECVMKDYDPINGHDIGDWLIHSYAKNGERDWFGHWINTDYPLTRNEYKLIEKLISCVEEEKEKYDREWKDSLNA